MNRFTYFACLLLLTTGLFSPAHGQTLHVLHSFGGSANNDGATLFGSITLSGSTLYGTTLYGGPNNGVGTVFKINTDGSGYGILHTFTSSPTDGSNPWGGVTVSGSTLYGTTELGGSGGDGTVFSLGTNGSNFALVHSFTGSDGDGPITDLLVNGSTIYGAASAGGGTADSGTIFQVGTNGSGFQNLHSFDGASGGQYPYSKLVLSGSTLFGTTLQGGGGNNIGIIYRANTDGTGFTVLHALGSTFSQGYDPFDYGGLVQIGSTLYGTAYYGGNNSQDGTLFSIQTDGTNFKILHTFAGGADGDNPQSGLTVDGSVLYGTTTYGGSSSDGTIYQINPDGSGYKVIYSFTNTDGINPFGALIADGSTLYGTTSAGGLNRDGTVFSITVPEPAAFLSTACFTILLLTYRRRRFTAPN